MSIHNSYFSRNNVIVYSGLTNVGRNPIIELFYGDGDNTLPEGFSRAIFDINIDDLIDKYNSGVISTDCLTTISHTLRMTNTSSFDRDFLNTETSDERLRATSFDLILWRIPYKDFNEDIPRDRDWETIC